MEPFSLHDLIADWHPPLTITVACVLALVVYVPGLHRLRRSRPGFPPWRAWSFAGGIAVLWLALASPLEELADTVLTAHMIEHLLLMAVVPPLLLAGWPTVPLLRGLPVPLRQMLVAPLLRSSLLRRAGHAAVSPVFAWLALNLTLLLWHIPRAYDYALEHETVHDIEHLCFFASSLLFWWVLLRPWPSQARDLGWSALLYLVTADFVNTLLSALLAFVGRPVYSYYLSHANTLGLDPATDQTIGACVMWVFGSIAFLLPAMLLLARLLQDRDPVQTIPTLARHSPKQQ